MNFNNVTFERSFGISSQLPPSTLPEVAFAGRSNVGKSSMLNALFGRKSLAKVSQKPGKTSTINFFATEGARFVDLPGYGYARVAKSEKGRWAELIEGYFNQDRNFALVVSLVDIRHEAQQLDLNMINFLMDAGLPFAVVLTKSDKLSRNQQNKQVSVLRRQLALPDDVPMLDVTSMGTSSGRATFPCWLRPARSATDSTLCASSSRRPAKANAVSRKRGRAPIGVACPTDNEAECPWA